MMSPQEFRREVIRVTLKAIDKPPIAWITFNDTLHTKILEVEEGISKENIELIENELPILECDMEKAYLLITTDRVISILDNVCHSTLIKDIQKFSNERESENYKKVAGKYPPTHSVTIIKKNGNEVSFLIDSHHPSYFVKILIYNILSFKEHNKWFINPRRNYYE